MKQTLLIIVTFLFLALAMSPSPTSEAAPQKGRNPECGCASGQWDVVDCQPVEVGVETCQRCVYHCRNGGPNSQRLFTITCVLNTDSRWCDF